MTTKTKRTGTDAGEARSPLHPAVLKIGTAEYWAEVRKLKAELAELRREGWA